MRMEAEFSDLLQHIWLLRFAIYEQVVHKFQTWHLFSIYAQAVHKFPLLLLVLFVQQLADKSLYLLLNLIVQQVARKIVKTCYRKRSARCFANRITGRKETGKLFRTHCVRGSLRSSVDVLAHDQLVLLPRGATGGGLHFRNARLRSRSRKSLPLRGGRCAPR